MEAGEFCIKARSFSLELHQFDFVLVSFLDALSHSIYQRLQASPIVGRHLRKDMGAERSKVETGCL